MSWDWMLGISQLLYSVGEGDLGNAPDPNGAIYSAQTRRY